MDTEKRPSKGNRDEIGRTDTDRSEITNHPHLHHTHPYNFTPSQGGDLPRPKSEFQHPCSQVVAKTIRVISLSGISPWRPL